MSIKDRWVGTREQVLNVLIACWSYGPSKPSSFVTTWPNHSPYMPRLAHGTENEVAQIDGRAGRSCGTKTSSADVWIWFYLVGTYQRLPCTGTACRETYAWRTWTARESVHGVLIRFPLQGVHRFESPRLSDMSNRLFVAVST